MFIKKNLFSATALSASCRRFMFFLGCKQEVCVTFSQPKGYVTFRAIFSIKNKPFEKRICRQETKICFIAFTGCFAREVVRFTE